MSKAFTLVEVVVAFALAAVLVVAVYSATQAMTSSAVRQNTSAKADARWRRFEEILRRDARGWIALRPVTVQQSIPGAPAKAPGLSGDSADLELLNFTTSAGSLSTEAEPARAVGLRYMLHGSAGDFALLRVESKPAQRMESGPLSAVAPLLLRHCAGRPKIEFFDGIRWRDTAPANQRPVALKLVVGERMVFIKL